MKNSTTIVLFFIFIAFGSSGCSYQGSLAPDENDPYEEINRSLYNFNENSHDQ